MKKILFFFIVTLMFALPKAKSQDTNIVYIPPQIIGCTTAYLNNNHYSHISREQYLNPNYCYNTYFTIGQVLDSIRFFAQPYYMDSMVNVIGIKARIQGGYQNAVEPNHYLKLMDMNFNTLDSVGYIGYNTTILPQVQFRSYYFSNPINIQNFYITMTFPDTWTNDQGVYGVDYTAEDVDSNCYLVACNAGHEPWLNFRGSITSFSEHPNFKYFKNTHLSLFPILKVKLSGLGKDIDLDRYTYVYPNPANEEINFSSSFSIDNIEIFDILGKKVLAIEIKDYSSNINLSAFNKGVYIAKIKTEQGIVDKKFVVK